MTARIGLTARPRISALRGSGGVAAVMAAGLLLVVAVVAIRGVLLAFEIANLPARDNAASTSAALQTRWPVLIIGAVCLAAALLTRRFRPAATLLVAFTVGGLVVLAGAIGTGTVGSIAVALALFAFSWLMGEVLLARLPAAAAVPAVHVPVVIGLGSGLLGLLLLLLATLGWLNTVTVLVGAGGLLMVVAMRARTRLAHDLVRLRTWRPFTPTWFETVVIGIVVALVAYAMLATFVPDVHPDAVADHLTIAREVWQTGSAPVFPTIGTSKNPIQAQVLYAVGYGFGGMAAVKLLHAAAGLTAIMGIAGIGWLCCGRLAAVVGAAVFASMPLVLAELGIALIDFFPTFYTVAAMLCVLLWQRQDRREWLLCAGALAGFAFAAKMTMGLMIVALAAAIFLVGRSEWRWRERLLAVVTFSLGGAVVVPWLVRSYVATGALEGLTILAEHASGTANSDLLGFGLGRSPLDIVSIPWYLTFHGELFHHEGAGDVGIALLSLLSLVVLAPRTRAVGLLAATTCVSFLGWALTAQLTRYLLPTVALAAALVGVGVASASLGSVGTTLANRLRRLLRLVVPVVAIVTLITTPLLLASERKLSLLVDIDVVTGRKGAAEFVAEKFPAAAALSASSALLPPDTPVGYVSGQWWDSAPIYTEARLTGLVRPAASGDEVNIDWLGTTPEQVLATLEQRGLKHFIWRRIDAMPRIWRSTLLSMDFLRSHTRILEGDRGVYLFEVLPGEGVGWGVGTENLLKDPDFITLGGNGPWKFQNRVSAEKGIVTLSRRESTLSQRVAASAGTPYLLLVSGACSDPRKSVTLIMRWFNDKNAELGAEVEPVIPGIEPSEQFLWHKAPERTAEVSVELTASRGCEFDEIALYGP